MSEPSPAKSTEPDHHAAFFRQSAWLMISNIAGGLLMWAVHFLSRPVGPEQYGVFVAFLALAMCIPTMPLQLVLAQQTAHGLATGREREVSALIRLVWKGTSVIWLAGSVVLIVFQQKLLARWDLNDAAMLWITLPVLLFSFWMPVFYGVLQGQQDFFWLGWSQMISGLGRIVVAVIAVVVIGAKAGGMMMGALLGMAAAVGVSIWRTRGIWRLEPVPFDWVGVLRQVIPLMFGVAAFQFIFAADTMFAKSYFDPETVGFYGSAGTLSRALIWLVGPLAAVMFPRIVHSTAKAEESNLVGLVLLGTAILAVCGAVGLSILGPFVVSIVSGPEYVAVATAVLPWYAGAMVPLALANVLLNNLLAQSRFRIVPPLCVLALLYGLALTRFNATPQVVLKTLFLFNVAMLVLAAWHTWGAKEKSKVH